MTQRELKAALHWLVQTYFSGANVVWGKVKKVRPPAPLITLNMGVVYRHVHPISLTRDGVPIDAYQSMTTLQVDLYTMGSERRSADSVLGPNENTAIDDMVDFLGFLGSGFVSDWCERNDISIASVWASDLTGLVDGASWEYRAAAELAIGFTQAAAGYAGIMYEGRLPFHSSGEPMFDNKGYALDSEGDRVLDEQGKPLPPLPEDEDGDFIYPEVELTPSGGRSVALARGSAGWFSKVGNIKENYEGGTKNGK